MTREEYLKLCNEFNPEIHKIEFLDDDGVWQVYMCDHPLNMSCVEWRLHEYRLEFKRRKEEVKIREVVVKKGFPIVTADGFYIDNKSDYEDVRVEIYGVKHKPWTI